MFIDHFKTTMHDAELGGEGTKTGVFKRFAILNERFISHYAGPADFFNIAIPIRDVPIAVLKLNCIFSMVGNCNMIGKKENRLGGVRPLRNIIGLNLDVNLICCGFYHSTKITIYFIPEVYGFSVNLIFSFSKQGGSL